MLPQPDENPLEVPRVFEKVSQLSSDTEFPDFVFEKSDGMFNRWDKMK